MFDSCQVSASGAAPTPPTGPVILPDGTPTSSAGALSLDPSGAANRPGSAEMTPQAHRLVSCSGASSPGGGGLVERHAEDRLFDLVELRVGRPPRRTVPLFPVAPSTSSQEAVEQPPHKRSLSFIHARAPRCVVRRSVREQRGSRETPRSSVAVRGPTRTDWPGRMASRSTPGPISLRQRGDPLRRGAGEASPCYASGVLCGWSCEAGVPVP